MGYGIVWLKVVITDLYQAISGDAGASEAQLTPRSIEEDLYLVKKKRAINRERFDISPRVQADKLPLYHGADVKPLFNAFEVIHDPLRQAVDGYSGLRTGLSPPVLFS